MFATKWNLQEIKKITPIPSKMHSPTGTLEKEACHPSGWQKGGFLMDFLLLHLLNFIKSMFPLGKK